MTPTGRRRPLRVQLTLAFAAIGVLPFAILVLWGVNHGRQESARARRELSQAATHMRLEMDEHLDRHRLAVTTLANALEMAGRPAHTSAIREWLAAVHERYPGFVTMMAADSAGRVVAVTPPDALAPGETVDVRDRDYFQVAAWGYRATFVSNAFRGRGRWKIPIVAISAPVYDAAGRFTGIVEGSLDLERLRRLELEIGTIEQAQVVVLDRDTTVVFGGGARRFEPLTRLAGAPFLSGPDGVVTLLRDSATGGRQYAVHATSVVSGWQVVVLQPWRAATAELTGYFAGLAVATLFAALLIAFAAPRVAARATRPVEQLATALREFSLVDPPAQLAVPDDAPAEAGDLAESFAAMATRTRRVISGLVPICAECKRIRNDQGAWEPVEQYVSEHSEARFTHGLCPHCLERLGFPPPRPSPPT